MKKTVFITAVLAAVLAAGYAYYTSDPNIVDESYIGSEGYRALEKQMESDQEAYRNSNSTLLAAIHRTLAIEETNRVPLPLNVSLDSVTVDTLLDKSRKIRMDENRLLSSEFQNAGFYRWFSFKTRDYTGILTLISLPGMYPNIEAGLTTVRDSTIIDGAMIGRFQKNLSELVITDIFFNSPAEIVTTVQKTRYYPVEQNNSVTYRYTISEDGIIEMSVLSEQ